MIDTEVFDNRPKVKTSRLNILPPNPEANSEEKAVNSGRFPSWLHRKLPKGGTLWETSEIMDKNRLHTVCEEARCPNLLECWSKKTATFLIMGKECTRSCGFCSIQFSKEPQPLDENEPHHVADSVKKLGLKHVVITMVARDDLEDGGAGHLAKVVQQVRKEVPGATIEILTSDFYGNTKAWDIALESAPNIFNYNIETTRELTSRVRHKATYERTLAFLGYAAKHKPHSNMFIKSGLMVGLGETENDVLETIQDLKNAGCDIITIGQYLQSDSRKLRVKSFVHPDQFKKYEEYGLQIGVKFMYCGPFVRSSYNADFVINEIRV